MLVMVLHKFGPLGKIITVLTVIIIILQVIQFSLLYHMDKTAIETGIMNYKLDLSNPRTSATATKIAERLKHSHIIDNSGSYYMIKNIVVPEHVVSNTSQHGHTTLVTHCTANHLDDLVSLTERWKAPVSLSVFTFDDDFPFAVKAILHFHLCNNLIRRYVFFHLVYPINKLPEFLDIEHTPDIDCDESFEDMKTFNVDNYALSGIPYPHNLLRNFAIKATQSDYVFVTDIDMIPSLNLHEDFETFVKRRQKSSNGTILIDNKLAFVVPSFEAKSSVDIPDTKDTLVSQIRLNNVRPFYWEVCQRCQKHTLYNNWEKLIDVKFLNVGYSVEWKDPWEPFFITDRNLPLYDERFKQYGFNRISQVCEMHIAGYRFDVLNNAFLVHKGFKFPGKFHKGKEEELNRNRILFRVFKENLKSKYPSSSRRCY